MAVVYISLGSNMGRRRENCLRALAELDQAPVGSLTGRFGILSEPACGLPSAELVCQRSGTP